MKIQDIIVESANRATAQQILDYVNDIHPEGLTDHMAQVVLKYPQWQLTTVNLGDLHIPDQDYDDPDQEPEEDPYNRVMIVDPEHAGEYSANFVDRRPIVIDDRGFIIDGNHRAWAAAELLNRDSIRAWVPAGLTESWGPEPQPGMLPVGDYLSPDSEFVDPTGKKDPLELIEQVDELIDAGIRPRLRIIKPTQLLATQDWLSNDPGDGPLYPEYADRPVVYQQGQNLYILDGHHRVTAALKSNRAVECYVFTDSALK